MSFKSVLSYAKINVGLYIKGKRADGFHELHSFFQEITLADKITFFKKSERGEVHLKTNWQSIPTDDRNTVVRATKLILENTSFGVDVLLEKRIPHQAGLGGGSSNAAATLLALNDLFELNKSSEQLHKIAEQLGSDVPFFLTGYQADIRGRGEDIRSISIPFKYSLLVVKPKFESFSTAEIYANYQPFLNDSARATDLEQFYKNPTVENLRKLHNDLEKALPETSSMQDIKKGLYQAGAVFASMTGSGSAVFGVFETPPTDLCFENCTVYSCESRSAE